MQHEERDAEVLGAMWEHLVATEPRLARQLGHQGRRSRFLAVMGRCLEACGRAFVVAAPPINGPG